MKRTAGAVEIKIGDRILRMKCDADAVVAMIAALKRVTCDRTDEESGADLLAIKSVDILRASRRASLSGTAQRFTM